MNLKIDDLRNFIDKFLESILITDTHWNILASNDSCSDLLAKYKDTIFKEIFIEDVLNGGYISEGKEIIISNKKMYVYALPLEICNEKKVIIIIRHNNYYDKNNYLLDENINDKDVLNMIMNSADERSVVIDKNGIIKLMSNAYKKFIGCNTPEGKHVRKVIENTRLHEILKTGEVEVGEIQEIQGKQMISMRFPLKKDEKIIGAIGKVMFKDISDLHRLNKKIDSMQKELDFYKNEFSSKRRAVYSIEDIIGESENIVKIKNLSKKIANTNSNVLIVGESGTGKELFAHSIHNLSNRRLEPFIKINCAAIPSELLESELFGYEAGAFTGANKKGKKGKFELAKNGTIFLDEIGDMPLNMQGKLLRVIQEKELERLGSNELKKVDVRIIAATNKNIEELVKKGAFREDLYYRLNVMKLIIPPLRERKEDIEILCKTLVINVAKRLGVYVKNIDKETIEYFMKYNWPGNIRELENVIERAINLMDSDLIIKSKHLPVRITEEYNKSNYKNQGYLKEIIEDVEKNIIKECLIKNNWNKNKTAKILGISRAGLYKKIDFYKL